MTRICTPTSRCRTRCKPWTGGGSPWTPGCSTGSTSPAPSTTTPPSKPNSPKPSASQFAERDSDTNKRPVREIVGIDPRLNEAWSSRATAITATTAELQARFRADHGRVPTTVEMISLRQQANLATRQAKHEPRSLNEQRAAWHDQAVRVLGGEPELHDMITTALTADAEPPPAVDASLIEKLAAQTVGTVAEHRAQWRESNLHAEALRVVRGTFPNPAQAATVAAAVTRRATGGGSFGADRDGHRDHRRPTHRAEPARRGIRLPGRESPAVHLTRRCWPPRPGSSPPPAGPTGCGCGPGMSPWRSWSGRRTPAAGC